MKIEEILESLDDIHDMMKDVKDLGSILLESESIDYEVLVKELNDLFTPVLIMQDMENDISSKVQSEITETQELVERNIINFDNNIRMAQLIATCALLIAKSKNSEKWQIFEKASKLKKQSKIDIQKEEYDNAKILAQKYLINVSTKNNSSVARNAANALLPYSQQ